MKTKQQAQPLPLLVALGLGLAAAAPAWGGDPASPAGTPAEHAWYIGGSVGSSHLEPRVTVPGGKVDQDNDTGYKAYVGYRLNERVAAEAFYADLGAAHIDIGTAQSNVDYQVYGAGLVINQPLIGRLQAQGKAGLVKLENQVDPGVTFRQVEDQSLYMGAGLEYALNKRVSLRAEYEYFDEDMQMLSAGINVRF